MKNTLWFLAALWSGLQAEASLAGYVVSQDVEVGGEGGKVQKSKHQWTVDSGKFVLSISGDSGATKYVFNGKTLYACGELDPKQTAALKKNLSKEGQKQLEKYASGACQVVPSNFMARFFLSPMASVESVDVADGLKLTMVVSDYKLDAKGGAKKLAGRDCAGFERNYTLTRTGDSAGGATAPAAVSEKFCQTSIEWRKNLWSEVVKTVLRQAKGKDLMQQLKKDQSSLAGFTLDAEGRQEVGGKVTTFKLKTASVVEAEVGPTTFQTPPGYQMFSPENLELIAQASSSKEDPKKKEEEGSLLDFMNSAVFCAIAGRLGCFAK